ncbi:hypothetical protein [Arthrobacter sp. MAHUQ-56]
MNTKHSFSGSLRPAEQAPLSVPDSLWRGANKALLTAAAAAVVLLLTGCGGTQASLTAAAGTTKSATPSPTPALIANTACNPLNSQQVSAGATYVCTKDDSGKLVWLESAESKRVTDKIAAAAAAKAAADKAAADKAAADKAAA